MTVVPEIEAENTEYQRSLLAVLTASCAIVCDSQVNYKLSLMHGAMSYIDRPNCE